MVPKEDPSGKILSSLRFIDELDQENILRTAKEYEGDQVLKKEVLDNSDSHLIDHAKRILLEKGLSVTALNHFLKCPSEFLCKSILKLPEAPAPSAEKGVAMHKAFDLIWQSKDKSESKIEEIMKNTLCDHLDKSFLYSFEKEAVKGEILENIPAIAKSLHEHFLMKGEVYNETWAESSWTGEFDGKKISIPIHGKLDALVDTGKDIWVFDYKTRGKMSENEIRGNTKSSNGNYFRQIVFYKLLLQNNSKYQGKNIFTSLVFVMPDTSRKCAITTLPVSKDDIESVLKQIGSLVEKVWSGKILSERCEGLKCEYCALLKI